MGAIEQPGQISKHSKALRSNRDPTHPLGADSRLMAFTTMSGRWGLNCVAGTLALWLTMGIVRHERHCVMADSYSVATLDSLALASGIRDTGKCYLN